MIIYILFSPKYNLPTHTHTHTHNIPLKTNQNVEQVNSHQNRFYNNFCEKKYRFEKPIKMYLKKMWQKSDFQNKLKKRKTKIDNFYSGRYKEKRQCPAWQMWWQRPSRSTGRVSGLSCSIRSPMSTLLFTEFMTTGKLLFSTEIKPVLNSKKNMVFHDIQPSQKPTKWLEINIHVISAINLQFFSYDLLFYFREALFISRGSYRLFFSHYTPPPPPFSQIHVILSCTWFFKAKLFYNH